MIDSPASAASDSDPHTGYFCSACKRRHEGQPYGSVGSSLRYCEPAIGSLVAAGVIAQDTTPSSGSRQYWLLKRDR
jgi:hypothetical protein